MEILHAPEFWVSVAFVAVVAFIYKPAMAGIAAALDGRAGEIRRQIEEARKLREDAQALLAEYQRKQRDAMAEAERIIQTARDEARRMKSDTEAELVRSIERRKQQALDRIAQSETQAIAQVRNTAIDVAMAAAGALMRDCLSDAQRQAMADRAIQELPKRLN
jgi:F-type H+-transporting ATPase subunit b